MPIPRAEKSYRLWCAVVSPRNLKNEAALARVGQLRQKKKLFQYFTFQTANELYLVQRKTCLLWIELQRSGFYIDSEVTLPWVT